MSKRRLTRQQRLRIRESQDSRQAQATSADANAANAEGALGPETSGLVISHFGQQLEVESLSIEDIGAVYRCHQRANLPSLVAGDKVIWQADGAKSGVVVALEERRNVFSRPSSGGQLRPVAANIDLALVVFAVLPEPFPNLIDRYLVALECLNITPVLVLNKVDLLDTEEQADSPNVGPGLEPLLTLYADLGYRCHRIACASGQGISALHQSLQDMTTVCVGQSGVGKSSLINQLANSEQAEVGNLSAGKNKGKHTTTTARLFHLDNCRMIDSPGIREFGLWHISPEQLFDGFIEFGPFANQCRFRDCSHQQEPDCALRQAVVEGKVNQQRLDSYFHILKSLYG